MLSVNEQDLQQGVPKSLHMRQRWLALLSGVAVAAGLSWSAVILSVVIWTQLFYPESIRGPGMYAFMGSGPFLLRLSGLAVVGGGVVAAAGFALKFTVSEGWRWRRLRREIIAVLVVVAAFVLPRFVLLPPPAPTARNDAEQDFARYAADQTWHRLAGFYQDRLSLTRDATDLLLMIWVTGWRVAEIEPINGVCGVHDRGWDVGSYRGIVRFYGPFGIPWYSVPFACPAPSGTVHPGG